MTASALPPVTRLVYIHRAKRLTGPVVFTACKCRWRTSLTSSGVEDNLTSHDDRCRLSAIGAENQIVTSGGGGTFYLHTTWMTDGHTARLHLYTAS